MGPILPGRWERSSCCGARPVGEVRGSTRLLRRENALGCDPDVVGNSFL